MRSLPALIVAGVVLLVIVMNALFIVRQDRQAIVLRLGQ